MSVFTAHLREEHKVILRILDLFDFAKSELQRGADINVSDLEMLVFALQRLVEGSHHVKEEDILFPALEASGKLQAGGPRCTYFMGKRLTDNVAEKLLALAGPKHQSPSATSSRSPLEIPLEEHEASAFALMRVKLELAQHDPGLTRAPLLIERISDYVSLMRLHIEKEDTCLFVLADQALDDATQANLLAKAQSLKQGPDNLQWIDSVIIRAEQSLRRTVA